MHDVTEILIHWQAGRSLKQIVRSLGMSRERLLPNQLARPITNQPPAERTPRQRSAATSQKRCGTTGWLFALSDRLIARVEIVPPLVPEDRFLIPHKINHSVEL